jgi:GT2 family glycosyltransferase
MHLSNGYHWYVTLNNDCQIKAGTNGNIVDIIERLDYNVLYGSGVNRDTSLPYTWQWSAWMCISQKVFRDVGYFDEKLDGAFEDFDYQKRAMDKGFTLDTAFLPIEHLDMHTRYEDKRYPKRWEDSRLWFEQKHGIKMARWYTDNQIAGCSDE